MQTHMLITLTAGKAVGNPVKTRVVLGAHCARIGAMVAAYGISRMDDVTVRYLTARQAERLQSVRSGPEMDRVNNILNQSQL